MNPGIIFTFNYQVNFSNPIQFYLWLNASKNRYIINIKCNNANTENELVYAIILCKVPTGQHGRLLASLQLRRQMADFLCLYPLSTNGVGPQLWPITPVGFVQIHLVL